jgi:hypothetical protein
MKLLRLLRALPFPLFVFTYPAPPLFAQPFSSVYTWLSGSNNSCVGQNSTHINARGGTQLVQHPTNASLRVLFGGYTCSFGLYTNTFVYDVQRPSASQWRYLEGSNATWDSGAGARPGARSEHCTLSFNNSIYIVGGYNNNGLNDIWQFDFLNGMWRWVGGTNGSSGTSSIPEGRYSHSCFYAPATPDLIYLYGGRSSVIRNGDMWSFDVKTRAFQWLGEFKLC